MWSSNLSPILVACVIVAWALKRIIQQYKNGKLYAFMASMPGAMSLPIIGNSYILAGVTSKTLFRTIMNHLNKYKRRSVFWIFNTPYFLTSDPLVVKAVLGSTQHVNKTKDYEYLIAQGNGVLTTNGPVWRRARKIINPAFRTSVIDSNHESFKYHTETFLESLKKAATSDSVDICLLVHTFTIDSVCDSLLGSRLNLLQQNQLHYAANMWKSTEMLVARFAIFQEWSDFIFSLLGKQRAVEEAVKPMNVLMEQIVEQKMKERMESTDKDSVTPGKHKSFMEILLDSVDSGTLSKREAIEESGGMFLGGTITTAVTISWVFKMLALRPDIQQKVYEEVYETCGGQEITLNDISKLVYLKMVVDETLRNFSVPLVGRFNEVDLTLDDGTTIPSGLNIILTLYELHHDPKYWEKPGEFYPEHFSAAAESNRPKGVFVPFLTGPRACPGTNYAMNVMRYLIANTLLRFEFHTDEKPSADLRVDDYVILFVLYPQSGFDLKIRERKSQAEPLLTVRRCSEVLEPGFRSENPNSDLRKV